MNIFFFKFLQLLQFLTIVTSTSLSSHRHLVKVVLKAMHVLKKAQQVSKHRNSTLLGIVKHNDRQTVSVNWKYENMTKYKLNEVTNSWESLTSHVRLEHQRRYAL